MVKARQTRLDAELDRHANKAAILLIAPAGFGKSSLIAQWRRVLIASGRAVIWLQAEPGWSARDLASRLAAAMPGAELAASDDPERLARQLCGQLASRGRAISLLIDDSDRLDDEAAQQLLIALVRNLRPGAQLICSARALPFARWHDLVAQGALGIVDRHILLFQPAESIAALASAQAGAKAAQLTALAMLADDVPLFVRIGCETTVQEGDPVLGATARIRAWLGETIWPQLDQAALALLADLAGLGETIIYPGFAEAVSADAGAALRLAEIERLTPLVRGSGDGSFRLHPALAVLMPGAPTIDPIELHRRAGRWLAERRPIEAIEHLLRADEIDHACQLLEDALMNAVTMGRVTSALRWLEDIPVSALEARPNLRVAIALALTVGGRDADLRAWVHRLGDFDIERLTLVIDALMACAADDPDLALAKVLAIGDTDPLAEFPAFAAVYRNLLRWLDQQQGLGSGNLAASLPREDVRREPRQFYSLCFVVFRDAECALERGQSRDAITALSPLLHSAHADLGPHSAATAFLSVALAAAQAQAGDNIGALTTLGSSLQSVETWVIPSAAWLAFFTRARVARDLGDFDQALSLIEEIGSFAESHDLHRVRALALAEAIRLAIASGGSSRAKPFVDKLQALKARADTLGAIRSRLVSLPATIGLAHALIAEGNYLRAADLIDEGLVLARQIGHRWDEAELHLLLLEIGGDGAIDPAGLIEASDLATLRRGRSLTGARVGRHPTLGQRGATPILLTAKEREILELLAAGVSNAQIAKALLVSTETIKWHLKNIFNKLEVHDRTNVVVRARDLALID